MAFYDTYGDSQNRRLKQQEINNQALQAFADFMQKQQMVKPENNLRNAQRGNFLAETEKTNLANQITKLKMDQYLRSQGINPQGGMPSQPMMGGSINVGGQTMTPQQLQANPGVWNGGQVQAPSGYKPIQKESEDLFGNKVITPEYQKYLDEKNKTQNERSLNTRKESIDYARNNPQVTEDTKRSIAAAEFAVPKLNSIRKSIQESGLNENSFSRIIPDILIDKKGYYFIKDGSPSQGSPLEDIISNINAIKLQGFAIAGAAYSDHERELIEGGFSPKGKSLSRWSQDIGIVNDYMMNRAKAGTRGLKESRSTIASLEKQLKSGNSDDTELDFDSALNAALGS